MAWITASEVPLSKKVLQKKSPKINAIALEPLETSSFHECTHTGNWLRREIERENTVLISESLNYKTK